MNAKEYDMMIFIGAGQGFPGSLSDHGPPGNPGIPGSRTQGNWVDEIFGQYRKTKAIKD